MSCSAVRSRRRDAAKNWESSGSSPADEQLVNATASSEATSARAAALFRRRLWRSRRLFVIFLFNEARNRHDLVLGLDVDESDALRCPSYGAHVVGLHADDHALLCDDEQF